MTTGCGSVIAPSLAAARTSDVCEAVSARQLDMLEARLMTMLASHIREAEKLSAFSARSADERLDALEQGQASMEHRLSELASHLQGGASAAEATAERRSLELATLQAEALERKLGADSRDGRAAASDLDPLAAVAPVSGGDHGRRSHQGRGDVEWRRHIADSVTAAVQDLEAVMQAELKAIHRRCVSLQDLLDDRTLLPFMDFEQRLNEQDLKVKQLTSAGQDCSSRVEEHEFRLGVARTKLEVHDQKISRLEAMRWQRGGSVLGSGCFRGEGAAVTTAGGHVPNDAGGLSAKWPEPLTLGG